MYLFCVRVCCGLEVVAKPKWIAIEKDKTFSDLLRFSTGDQFTKRKVMVVVCGEVSLNQMFIPSIKAPLDILKDQDKRIVSFLVQPDGKRSVILVRIYTSNLSLNLNNLVL